MKNWNLFTGIGLAVLGLLVIIFPTFWFKVVVILLGLASIAYGIYSLKFTRTILENSSYELSLMIKGIVSIVVGVSAVAFPLAIGNAAWTVMIWILVGYLIVSAILGFYAAALLKDSKVNRKKYFLENLGLLAIAVFLIILTPNALAKVIFRIVGIVAIVAGAVIILIEIVSNKKAIVVKSDDVEVKDAPAEETETPDNN
ncbi:MAG: DUF308 domain-containing protein [Treponema sp.]|nr:DUF308 domain-containing protein [Spirochaetales bacterium]MDY6190587.1 DUF308 domain-containing protein [Treponema sp.]